MIIIRINKLFFIILLFWLFLPFAALAIDGSTIPKINPDCGKSFCLNIPIGQLTGFDVVAGSSIMGDYIKSWYGFLLGTVGILATIMIMWGGFKYLVSRGDKASIESAKTQMISAVTGIVLAFGTYTLLYLINPALLTINTPNLPGIQGGENVDLAKAQAYAKQGRSDYPSTTGKNNPANLASTPQIQGVSPKGEAESGSSALARNAQASLGQPIGVAPETQNGTLGCALAVDQVVHASGLGSGGYNLGVDGLYDELSNNGNFTEIPYNSTLQPGDVVLSIDAPKPEGGTRSHTGIVLNNGNILSNSSGTGTFSWEATPSYWSTYYPSNQTTMHILRPKN